MSQSEPMRKCFRCHEMLPVSAYNPNGRKYQISVYLGRCLSCKKCMIKLAQEDMKAVRINPETDKFEVVKFNSIDEIIEFYN